MNLDKLKDAYVIMLIGLPWSGKTSWIKKNFEHGILELMERDQIVMDGHGVEDYNIGFKSVEQNEVERILVGKLSQAGKEGKNAIVDMSHMNSKR